MDFQRRRLAIFAASAAVLSWPLFMVLRPAPDTTPEGAYMRIASAIAGGDTHDAFAYLEDEAQHAAFSIGEFAKRATRAIRQGYPADEQGRALQPYAELAKHSDGPQVWATLARQRGWVTRLRRDLSGVVQVEIAGTRASVTTARGTRYPFRRRPNGIWGLTLFTAELGEEAKRLARHTAAVESHSSDFQRASGAGSGAPTAPPPTRP
jgi:hypothetical protein